jgi:hypothetical protein
MGPVWRPAATRLTRRCAIIVVSMKILNYDPLLHHQLRLCLDGDYVSRESDELTPAMRDGLLRSLETAEVGEVCRCGQSDCHSFQIAGGKPTVDSRRVRFVVYGELSVICDATGGLQCVEWLPVAPTAGRHFENTPDGWQEREVCRFPI